MLIRKYRAGEEGELWNLFFHTIRKINCQHYSPEQLQAWAPDDVDAARWQSRIEGIDPYVCVHEGEIIGYADLQDTGYIDHFYVHHQWQRRGVGTLLLSTIDTEARQRQLCELSSDVSITARPFFESRGFTVVSPQEVSLGAVVLINYKMIKRLSS